MQSILIIGSGPIVIGQACEFDYSGAQACKALRREGYRIILVNANPATIMTDPELADVTYIEPLTVEILEKIIARERPDALLPTVGGQTGLNLAMALAEAGVLERYGVRLLGASREAIEVAESREHFRQAMLAAGLPVPQGRTVNSVAEALDFAAVVGYPVLVRPSFTLGGSGGGIARDAADLERVAAGGLRASPVGQVLIEQSVLGWKEYELEVMRDGAGNFVVVCSIENLDPMGVHTGDSITVAPAMTLTDREYQRLRDLARRVMDVVGIQTGGSNVQFAVDPATGQPLIIEMNPRVSRSSALASKATGFPIAKIAALVAVGRSLDQIPNDITRQTPASFEPSLDYVVVKIPRFAFEKFRGVDPTLGPQMKSVGEVMAIGDTFAAALNKALRGLEVGLDGFGPRPGRAPWDRAGATAGEAGDAGVADDLGGSGAATGSGEVADRPAVAPEPALRPGEIFPPLPERLQRVAEALAEGATEEQVAAASGYDPWFVAELAALVALQARLAEERLDTLPEALLWEAKQAGLSDRQIGRLCGGTDPAAAETAVRELRAALGIRPVFRRVDTCAAEFEAFTPYLYSAYVPPVFRAEAEGAGREAEGAGRAAEEGAGPAPLLVPVDQDEAQPGRRPKVMVLGGGPNRIGQGIEFDYCCVHACQALSGLGFETLMVNCNPETVSTDYDTADRLYFEPLTAEDVLAICELEKPDGVLVQFGGQTPLNLARALEAAGVTIWGTSPETIDLAEDRERFGALLRRLDIPQPEAGIAHTLAEAEGIAERIGYPVLVRPSYVLGGRAMAIVYGQPDLDGYLEQAAAAAPGKPILVDAYLEDAVEVDVDALCDGERVVIGGVMQHIEEAGVHSGDSAMVLPPYRTSAYHLGVIRDYTEQIGLALGVRGLMNVQYAVKDDVVYVLEVNPRCSRTAPFIAKATGLALARVAAEIAAGRSLAQQGILAEPAVDGFFVKEAVLPFDKMPGAAVELGPEMRSTGEVMGHASSFGHAFAKAALGAGVPLPTAGTVLITVNDFDKGAAAKIARDLHRAGFTLMATSGTADYLERAGLPVERVNKVSEGSPHVADVIAAGQVRLVISTPLGPTAYADGQAIRRAAITHRVLLLTTLSAATASVTGIRALQAKELTVRSLQEHYRLSAGR